MMVIVIFLMFVDSTEHLPCSGKWETQHVLHFKMSLKNITVSWKVPPQLSNSLKEYVVQYKQAGTFPGHAFSWVKLNKSQTTAFFKGLLALWLRFNFVNLGCCCWAYPHLCFYLKDSLKSTRHTKLHCSLFCMKIKSITFHLSSDTLFKGVYFVWFLKLMLIVTIWYLFAF